MLTVLTLAIQKGLGSESARKLTDLAARHISLLQYVVADFCEARAAIGNRCQRNLRCHEPRIVGCGLIANYETMRSLSVMLVKKESGGGSQDMPVVGCKLQSN